MLINSYRFATASTPWTPAQITTALWLDASDAGTVDASSVGQWNDKSGNGRNATQGTAANKPTYTAAGQNGLNVLTFDGTNDWMAIPDSTNPSGASGTFAACKPTHTAAATGLIIGRAYNWGPWYLSSTTTGASARYNLGRNGVDEASAIVTGLTNSTNKILSGTYNNTNVSLSVDGGTAVNTAYAFNPIYNTNDSSTIGAFRSGSSIAGVFGGLVYEIIVVHSAPSQDTIQRIQGYLAHKWGLTANLPAGHPYKSAAPTV